MTAGLGCTDPAHKPMPPVPSCAREPARTALPHGVVTAVLRVVLYARSIASRIATSMADPNK